MATIHTAWISNDMVVQLDRLADVDGTWIDTATVTFTLKDSDGSAVTGADTITMSHVASSTGRYRGTLADTVSLVEDRYTVEVTATGAAGQKFFFTGEVRARVRNE